MLFYSHEHEQTEIPKRQFDVTSICILYYSKMQIRWKITSTLLNVTKLLWCLANIVNVSCDKTTCRSSIETGNGLHFICFCDVQDFPDSIDNNKAQLTIDLKPDSDGKNDFSLQNLHTTYLGLISERRSTSLFNIVAI